MGRTAFQLEISFVSIRTRWRLDCVLWRSTCRASACRPCVPPNPDSDRFLKDVYRRALSLRRRLRGNFGISLRARCSQSDAARHTGDNTPVLELCVIAIVCAASLNQGNFENALKQCCLATTEVEDQTTNSQHRVGGGGEIRTHEAFRPSGFQDRRNQPLCHPSRVAHVRPEIHYPIARLLQVKMTQRFH